MTGLAYKGSFLRGLPLWGPRIEDTVALESRPFVVVLDLGCGARKAPGTIGVDIHPLPGVDVVCDLSSFPWPFAPSSADGVRLNHVLEHLDDPLHALEEVWRISRPGAWIDIRVPHYTGRYAWKDPTHKRCFSSQSFAYFGENPYSYYTIARFRTKSVRLRYFMEPPRRTILRVWGRLVQWLLDRHPTFSERFLAYAVGGIDEIQVALETIKDERWCGRGVFR